MKELTNAMTWTANDESDYIFLFGEEYGQKLWAERNCGPKARVVVESVDTKNNTIWLVSE